MAAKKAPSKDDLIKAIIDRKKVIMNNPELEVNLVNLIIPFAGEGKIKEMDPGTNNVTIEFSAPIMAMLDFVTKTKLAAFIDLVNDITKG